MAKSRVRVIEKTKERASSEADGLWSVAMLRIAVEMKQPGAPSFDKIVDSVVTRMGIPKEQFKKYLSQHLATLKRTLSDR